MKKILFSILVLTAALFAVSSCSKDNDTPEKTKVTKIADYLYEFEAEGYSTEPPTELKTNNGGVVFGCSAVRNGNFYGRNLDLDISETCEFVVRTKATQTRKHASIGVVHTCFLNVTNDMVKAGLSDELLKYLPWMTMDGINDAGLVCNINVTNTIEIKSTPHTHTNPGKPQVMVMNLVRALLDNCGSVDEAKTFINSHDILPIPTSIASWDGHIMIADANNTVIVEFTGEKGNEVKFVVQEQMIMTNFYNHLFHEKETEKTKKFPMHACGMERYNILSENYANGNSMEGMWGLMKMVRYTQAYDEKTEPFWVSEHVDAFPDGDITWSKEKLLAQPGAQRILDAYQTYKNTGKYDPEDHMWFTAHNSTYDIENRALWVTVREKYEAHYDFKL